MGLLFALLISGIGALWTAVNLATGSTYAAPPFMIEVIVIYRVR